MKIYHSIKDFKPTSQTIVTLGTFDGVHIGHKKIIERLVSNAAANGGETVILTFFPHPRMILQDGSDIKLLNTIDEKSMLLDQCGIDHLIIHPFDQEFSRLTAEEFVQEILVNQFQLKKIIIGHDHRFGRNRTANIDDLINFGNQFSFEVEQISAQEIDEVSVSSTKIRNALFEGNCQLANEYLGYPYILSGTVEKGKSIGRTINFPTANLHIKESYKLIPKNGVYIVSSLLNNKTVFGMMNIGFNPTVNGEKQSIEIHFFNWNADLYNQKIQVNVLERIREEQKFDSIDDLKIQLQQDQNKSLQMIEKFNR
ncbi:bifunctional riboflavin kinase/FAD synthetase [Flavobacterium sp. UBA6135]|uniref:bifunctional riboflavin kinase/FAD synthetase n=1 Tax=Flavobacterium sp. UBA6135 TaxID=1946553 RepID=UPI0025BDD942|nr:bifunctional riboflavin kinase/FAD synthetase [Flavobacterium sp. UBA6135]